MAKKTWSKEHYPFPEASETAAEFLGANARDRCINLCMVLEEETGRYINNNADLVGAVAFNAGQHREAMEAEEQRLAAAGQGRSEEFSSETFGNIETQLNRQLSTLKKLANKEQLTAQELENCCLGDKFAISQYVGQMRIAGNNQSAGMEQGIQWGFRMAGLSGGDIITLANELDTAARSTEGICDILAREAMITPPVKPAVPEEWKEDVYPYPNAAAAAEQLLAMEALPAAFQLFRLHPETSLTNAVLFERMVEDLRGLVEEDGPQYRQFLVDKGRKPNPFTEERFNQQLLLEQVREQANVLGKLSRREPLDPSEIEHFTVRDRFALDQYGNLLGTNPENQADGRNVCEDIYGVSNAVKQIAETLAKEVKKARGVAGD